MDAGRHQAATGVSNQVILANLRTLAGSHTALWIRLPVVPGLNDDLENLDATADFLTALPGIHRVDLLPYHPTGEAKFARVGMACAVAGTPPPSPERLEALALSFRARGLETTIGGRP